MSNHVTWGYHLLIDVAGCSLAAIRDRENIYYFVKQLVKDIDMVAYGEPMIEHFATHDPDKAGYSLVQLIETSNITAHFVDKDGSGYIDVFSCKPFDDDVVLACIKTFFFPEKYKTQFVYRDAPKL
jgi:S-adenosylmethionine/arginine decarboxylase-like enzyme